MKIFRRIHRDVYTVSIGMLILVGLITLMLVTVNPLR